MNYKLIAFDLDGTFLRDDKSIPQENMDALEKAAGAGIYVVPSSGRILAGIPAALREAAFIRYYICVNGSMIYDKYEDKIICRNEIPCELALRCIDHMNSVEAAYDCYQEDWGYMNAAMLDNLDHWMPYEGMYKLIKALRKPVPDLRSFLADRGRDVQKLQMFFADLDLRRKELELIPKLFPELIVSTSVPNNIEINHISSTKGQALSKLCSLLDIGLKDTVAIGDGTNDIDMLSFAGLGIAMENSDKTLFEHADYVTKSNMDCGVAAAIEKILMNEI